MKISKARLNRKWWTIKHFDRFFYKDAKRKFGKVLRTSKYILIHLGYWWTRSGPYSSIRVIATWNKFSLCLNLLLFPNDPLKDKLEDILVRTLYDNDQHTEPKISQARFQNDNFSWESAIPYNKVQFVLASRLEVKQQFQNGF